MVSPGPISRGTVKKALLGAAFELMFANSDWSSEMPPPDSEGLGADVRGAGAFSSPGIAR